VRGRVDDEAGQPVIGTEIFVGTLEWSGSPK
jgi:hypothetical protein